MSIPAILRNGFTFVVGPFWVRLVQQAPRLRIDVGCIMDSCLLHIW